MTALDEAEAALRDARRRNDTRSIHAAQIALRLAVRQELRDDNRRRQEQLAARGPGRSRTRAQQAAALVVVEARMTADTPPPAITETRFIRPADRDQYEREGWEVTPMASFHCQWSHIAVREVRVG